MDPFSPQPAKSHQFAYLDSSGLSDFDCSLPRNRIGSIVKHTISAGPKSLGYLGIKLDISEAEEVCSVLQQAGIQVQPYDFHSTDGVWVVDRPVSYRFLALRELMDRLSTELDTDYQSVDGFKRILPRLSGDTICSNPINGWGTTLAGMIDSYYRGSVPRAILDFLRNDPVMVAIRKVGIEENDLPFVPRRYWVNSDNSPSDASRMLTDRAIRIICGRARDPRQKDGFAWLLENVTQKSFRNVEVSPWGTTPAGMVAQAYDGSHVQAIIDLVENNPHYREIRKIGVYPFNFKRTPNSTLTVRQLGSVSGEEILVPTHEARAAVRMLIETLAKKEGVSAYTVSGMRVILPLATRETCESVRLGEWKTPLRSVLRSAYHNSIARAICDLVENDSRFSLIKRAELGVVDFPRVPRGTWCDHSGAATDNARKVARLGVEAYARELGVDPYSIRGFLRVGEELTVRRFREIEVNQWGTKPGSMLKVAYNDKLALMFLDLLENDSKFKELREIA